MRSGKGIHGVDDVGDAPYRRAVDRGDHVTVLDARRCNRAAALIAAHEESRGALGRLYVEGTKVDVGHRRSGARPGSGAVGRRALCLLVPASA